MAKLNFITPKEELTMEDITTIFTIKYLLEQITLSNKYEIQIRNRNISIVLYTTKYLYPIDIDNGRNYTNILHGNLNSKNERAEVINTLHFVKKYEGMNTDLNYKGLPLHQFIREVNKWVGMCISMHTYRNSLNERYLKSETYNLNPKLKEILYTNTKELITNISYAGTDNEGLSYNSSTMLLAI